MSEDELAQVFEPFYRAQRHGIGLTIVERPSDRFGWPLQIHSVLGEGTVTSIQLPSADAVREGPFPYGDGAD